jgi:hypothetical protein
MIDEMYTPFVPLFNQFLEIELDCLCDRNKTIWHNDDPISIWFRNSDENVSQYLEMSKESIWDDSFMRWFIPRYNKINEIEGRGIAPQSIPVYRRNIGMYSSLGFPDEITLIIHLYSMYKFERDCNFYYSSDNPLQKYYSNLSYDYELMPVSDSFVMLKTKKPLLFDKAHNQCIIVDYISGALYSFIAELKSRNSFSLSIRPNYFKFSPGIKKERFYLLTEALEVGSYAKHNFELLPVTSKLYDEENYENRILVHRNGDGELTFEETVGDFRSFGEGVVTQVVHMCFVVENGVTYITHIDHEYVFYKLDEYFEKPNDIKQKGTMRKRFKTFKIDDAHIEYVSSPESNIVYRTIDSYFKNKKLIQEYFSIKA